MATVAELQADLDALQVAIDRRLAGRGHIDSFSAQGKTFQFTSLKEMFELRRQLREEITRAKGPRQIGVRLGRRNRR